MTDRNDYAYEFSVIMAVYNTAAYLREAIESVVAQSIGFDKVQLILVDDGSTDGSAAICDEYAEQYPENVACVHQENAGVSAARNAGLELVRGRYVNFLDSDDKWSEEAFEQAEAFFAAHPEVRLAACRYKYFDAKKGGHRLNYKFKEDRVVDLKETYDYPQLSSSTCFFEAGIFQNRRFDTSLKVSEDTLLVNEVLLDDLRYGVMSDPTYWYRSRRGGGSAIDTMREKKSWYFDTTQMCYEHLFDECEKRYGEVLPFLQFTIMYDLQWRLRSGKSQVLSVAENAEYREVLCGLLRRIDDSIISEQRTISIDYVAYAMCLKYGVTMSELLQGLAVEDGVLCTRIAGRNVRLRPLDRLSSGLTVEREEFAQGHLTLEGFITSFRFPPEDLELVFYVNNRPVKVGTFVTDKPMRIPFDDRVPGKTGFRFGIDIPKDAVTVIRAEVSFLGQQPVRMFYRAGSEAFLADDKPGENAWHEDDAMIRLGLTGVLSITRD